MVKIIVLERNAMLRTGIVQFLSHVLPGSTIEAYGYALLDQPPDESMQGGLVLLSIPSPERRDSLIQASERAFAPRGIILMLDGEPTPALMHALPPIVGGFVDKAAAPDVFLACIRVILAGGKTSPWLLDSGPSSTSTCAPSPASVSAPVPLLPGPGKNPYLAEPQRNPVPFAGIPAVANVTPEAARNESSLLGLTPRQYEVLVLLARGNALKTIARQLNITVATTKAHTEGLYQRLDVHNRNAAVYVARSRGAGLGWAPRQGSLELKAPQE